MAHRRKPTKKEALDRLASLPNFKKPTKVTALPPPLRPIAVIPYIFDQGGKAIARVLIAADPYTFKRIDNSRANRIDAGEVFDTDIVEQQRMINDPSIIMDEVGNVIELLEPLREAGVFKTPSAKSVKKLQKNIQTGRDYIRNSGQFDTQNLMPRFDTAKPKRKASAYNKRYSAAFKKVAPQFKKKSGGWKKDGFKRAGAAARKIAKK